MSEDVEDVISVSSESTMPELDLETSECYLAWKKYTEIDKA